MVKWLVILAVVGLIAGGARWAWVSGWPQTDQPAATKGVIKDADRNNWDQASSKLTTVLAKSFPVGSSAAEVQIRLRNQGFLPLRQCPGPTLQKVGAAGFACGQNWDPDHALHYSWGPRNPCRHDMAVFWTDDSSGRVTSIQGQYSCS
jgi:hypothetical protein